MMKLFLIFSVLLSVKTYASSLSYSGRLVNSNGSPVTGSVNLQFDLSYSSAPSVVVCSQTQNSVTLSQGVFHVELNFASNCLSSQTLDQVISAIPNGETLSMRVTDLSNSKVYPLQAIHSVPLSIYANVAKTIDQMGASNGQFLKWDGSKWAPATLNAGAGSVTEVNTGSGLTGGPITSTGTISIADGGVTDAKIASGVSRTKLSNGTPNYVLVNNGSGVISEVASLTVSQGGTGATSASTALANLGGAPSVGVICDVNTQKLHWYVGVGWGCANDTSSDSLPSNGGTMNGAINMNNNPITNLANPSASTDAATKGYADSLISAISPSLWSESAGSVYRLGGNVGVGTSSPVAAVDVISGGSIFNPQINLTQTSNTDYSRARLNANGNIFDIAVGSPGSATPNAMNIFSSTLGGNIMTLNSSGNVGIGTSTPTHKLNVTGNVGANPLFTLFNSTFAGYTQMGFYGTSRIFFTGVGNGGETTFGIDGKYYLYDQNANQIRYAVDSTGNMGIGTTSPTQKLDVSGNIRGSGWVGAHATYGSVQNRRFNLDDNTYVVPGGNAFASNGWNFITANGFNIQKNAGADLFTVKDTGNVGVGTVSPQATLDVNGKGFFRATTGGLLPAAAGKGIKIEYSSGQDLGHIQSWDYATGIAKSLILNSVGGNVGIGTSVTNAPLSVAKNDGVSAGSHRLASFLKDENGGFDSAGFVLSYEADGSNVTHSRIYIDGLQRDLRFSNYDGATVVDRMTISGNGNVGIGVTNPSEKLEVSGKVKATELCIGSDCKAAWPATATPVDDSVTSAKIVDGAIVDADINASANIAQTKILNLTTDLASKEPLITAGTTTQYLDGTKNLQNFTSSVLNSVLSGYTTGSALPLSATDTVLQGLGKLEGSLASVQASSWTANSGNVYRSSGNVGIRTSTPTEALEVNGNVKLTGSGTFSSAATTTISSGGNVIIATNTYISSGNAFFGGSNLRVGSGSALTWSNNTSGNTGTADLFINRDASNTLGISNGTTAQNLRIYNTKTDAANYERAVIDWQTSSNLLRIGTEAAGSGTVRNISLVGGNVGVGTTSPTSKLHLAAGAATANSAPLKFTSGTLLSTPEDGAVEFDGTNLYYTSSGNRKTISFTGSPGVYDLVSQINNSSGSISLSPGVGSSVNVTSSTISSSPSSGALIVSGGVGVSGAVNASNEITSQTYVLAPTIYGSSSASGNLTLDSTTNATKGNILLVPNGGNVGIGTIAPDSTQGKNLHIYNDVNDGTVNSNATLVVESENRNANIVTVASATSTSALFFRNTSVATSAGSGRIQYNHANQDLSFWTNNSQKMNIDNAGNVGIGTTSPSMGLVVEKDNGNGYAAQFRASSVSPGVGLGTLSGVAGVQGLTSGGTVANLTINSYGGNVGIGTTTPTHVLDVVDNGNDAGMKFTEFSNTYPADFRIFRARGTQAGPTALQSNDVIGGMQFYGYGASTAPTARSAAIEAIASETYTGSARGSHLSFKVAANGTTSATEAMRISQAGNVGIGTSTPAETLAVQKDQSTATIVSVKNASNNSAASASFSAINDAAIAALMGVYSSTSPGYGPINASEPYFYTNGVAINIMADHASGKIKFSSGGNTERMRITETGNVGIGTTNPNAKLDVNGTIRSGVINDSTPTSMDWSLGNNQYTTSSCTGVTWTLNNLVDGATYTLAVQGNSHTGSCIFSDGSSTFKYQPANTTPSPTKDVIYTFTKFGSVVYVSWIDGW